MMRFLRILIKPFRRVASAGGRLHALSTATGIALAVGFVLLVVLVVAVATTGSWLTWNLGRIALAVMLIPAISFAVWLTIKVWLQGEVSPFPDIWDAWQAGLAALDREGISLQELPVFLVLGSPGAQESEQLFAASGLETLIRGVPKSSSAPLHWYATQEGIFIVCTHASHLSKLAEVAALSAPATPAPVAVGRNQTLSPLQRTLQAVRSESIRSTVGDPVGAEADVGEPSAAMGNIRSTLAGVFRTLVPGLEPVPRPATPSRKPAVSVSREAARQAVQRLAYLCSLLRGARLPFCPLNGILTLLPWEVLRDTPPDASEITKAVRQDLSTIGEALQLRCPVTAVVIGMEQESGFLELMRRVRSEFVSHSRFGKGFNVWSFPTHSQLEALCEHACGAFEDTVYRLFRGHDVLEKPSNPKLYKLWSTVRGKVQPTLNATLQGAYGCDVDGRSSGAGFLFGGCYFAATGAAPEQQGFFRSVCEKLVEQQDAVAWSEEAIRAERRRRQLARVLFAADAALGLLIVALLMRPR